MLGAGRFGRWGYGWWLATVATKADHAWGVKVSVGPVWSLLSRTSTRPGRLSATSTHSLDPDREDFLQFSATSTT